MKTLKPLGDRVILKIKLLKIKDAQGNEQFDLDREAKVIESNSEEIQKGDTVYYNPRGCVQIETLKTKKDVTLIIDACDVYAVFK